MDEEFFEKSRHITVLGFDKYHGSKPFTINGIIKLVKEPENKYDTEAIAANMRYFGKIGYVANSTRSVITGTMSSGRLYDKIDDEYYAKIKFITSSRAVCEILSSEEYTEELKNPESDIHFISTN